MSTWIAVLAGGGGTRLWPMSRRSRPKQFLPLLAGGETLLGATVRRLLPLAPAERILVVTAASQVGEVRRAVPALPESNFVVEPVGRNTAPAIGLAALEVARRDPAGILAVIPSDQFVSDEAGYLAALQQAIAAAQQGSVATIGIRPSRPETGYGYIERGARTGEGRYAVARFVEKPDRATAERYLAAGTYLWNAGMFFFAARRMLDEIRALVPALADVLDALAQDPAKTASLYPTAPAISVDYAVMEKLPARGGMEVVPGDFGWSDVGSWDALADVRPADADGNAALGDLIAVDAKDNVVAADRLVALVGVHDLVVVASGNAVLVMPRDRAQDVREIVKRLEARSSGEHL